MSYNGSGTFLINSAGQPVVPGTTITTTAFNALTADLASGLTTAMTKDGQTVPTANIPMGGFKLTGLGAGTSATDAAQFGQLQNAPVATLITVSGADTITGTLVQTLTAYATGQQFSFVAAGTNTTAVTLNIDGLGAKDVTRTGAVALAAGALVSGQMAIVEYDGTRFQLINANAFTNLTVSGALTVGTTLAVTGVATLTAQPILSSLTASLPVFSDASKGLVSNTMTGTGSVMMSASPTTTGTLTAAAINASGLIAMAGAATVGTTLGVTGVLSALSTLNVTGLITASTGLTVSAGTTTFGAEGKIAQNGSGLDLVPTTGRSFRVLNAGMSASQFSVAEATGNTLVGGTLGVTGTSTMAAINASDVVTISKTNSLANLTLQTLALADGYSSLALKNLGGSGIVAISRSAGNDIFTGSTGYALNVGTLNAYSVQLGTNSVVRLTIDSSGAVTIPGTLGVKGVSTLTELIRNNRVTSGNTMDYEAYNASGVGTAGVLTRIRTDGGGISNDYGELSFWTGQLGVISLAERMRINVSGIVSMPVYGAGAATFSAAGVISSVSDERLKIKDGVIADPIPMMMALEPGYYFGKPEAHMGEGRQLGFYAQNVRKAIGPEAAPDPEDQVNLDADGNEVSRTTRPWGYYDRSVLAVAIEALKVHEGRLAALQADFQSYKNSHP